jgi:hypothetical protein
MSHLRAEHFVHDGGSHFEVGGVARHEGTRREARYLLSRADWQRQ